MKIVVPGFAKNGVHAVSRVLHKPAIFAGKNAPTILVVTGVVGMVGTTVLASRATLKVSDILKEASEEIGAIKELSASSEATKKEATKMLAKAYGHCAFRVTKLYLPSLILGSLSIAAIFKAHNILQSRTAAVAAAYAGLDKAYRAYRDRVIEEFGEEKDLEFRLGARKGVDKRVDDATGNIVDHDVIEINPNEHSPYTKCFDESNPNFKKEFDQNLWFLTNQQNWANDKLRARGHLFLNEVHEMLGLPHTSAGSVTGWVLNSPNGDGYVDFGIFDLKDSKKRDFVNGYERAIWLDFNVDGIIYDQI